MSFDAVVFDLDGTLWDTCDACAIAWNNVLRSRAINHRPIVAEDVRKVTGLPHDECIRRTFPTFTEMTIQQLIDDTAVEDNRVIAINGGNLYPGVAEGLTELAGRYRLAIVSNCQSGYIETFLRLSGFGPLFEDIECFGNTGRPKGDNLSALIARQGLVNPLMIGDAAGDETAARFCGIPFAFVTYGFGTAIGPDYSFDSFPALTAALLD